MERRSQWFPMFVTAAVLGALVWWAQRRTALSPTEMKADAVIWAMVQACRKGDASRYLDCFAGKLREHLEKVAQEQGEQTFAASLRQMIAPVKGIAVFEPKRDGQASWRIVVEFVFTDRTERQTFRVRQIGDEWRIVEVETVRPVPVLVPYGTPVRGL